MDSIRISDITMKQIAGRGEAALSFKGKLEIAKLLDRLGVSVIEVEGLAPSRSEALRVKTRIRFRKNRSVYPLRWWLHCSGG